MTSLKGYVDLFFTLQAKIRETMEKAFWDGIAESVKQGEHNYDRIIQLVREVRDEICGMAPQSWKEEITEAIDPEILSQVVIITACTAAAFSYTVILNLLNFL